MMTRWTILAFGTLICLFAPPALASEELVTGLYSDEGDIEQISAIMGKDMGRYYARRRPHLRDEPHAYAKFLYKRYTARKSVGVFLATFMAPIAISGTVIFGTMWRDVDKAEEEDGGSGPVNFGLGLVGSVVPSLTILCAIGTVASIAGGVALWVLNIERSEALKNLAEGQEESSSHVEKEKISVSVVPFVAPDGSAGLGLAGSF